MQANIELLSSVNQQVNANIKILSFKWSVTEETLKSYYYTKVDPYNVMLAGAVLPEILILTNNDLNATD